MKTNTSAAPFSLIATGFLLLAGLALQVHGQTPASGEAKSVTPLMERMTGDWNVQQRMWAGPDAAPTQLPQAVVRRRLVGNAFLEEKMEPAGERGKSGFARVAYFSYNPINQQYEYFSMDSRAPQMMSYTHPGANKMVGDTVELVGGTFVAPEWGPAKNVPFTYRISLGPVGSNEQQTVRLFLKQQSVDGKEFLAFEYVYTRAP